MMLGAPILLLIIAGLFSLVVENAFSFVAIPILLGSLVVLVFHEQIFAEGDVLRSDPIPDGALRSFASVGLLFTSLGVAIFALKPFVFISPTISAYPGSEILAFIQIHPTIASGQLRDSLLLIGLTLVIVTPIAALMFYGFAQHKRVLGKAAIIGSLTLLLAALVLLLTRDTPELFGVGDLLVRVNTLICIYAVIFFVTGLITFAFFFIWINAPERFLETLVADQALTAFAVPIGVGLGDVVTIAQGFSGLKEHYPFMGVVATIGAFVAVLSILFVLAFSGVFIFRGFSRHSVCHYLFAAACALLVGGIILAALAEAGGLLYSVTAGRGASGPISAQ
ncbi:MAG TPA: hypothetical protein VF006_15525 [Longimicrobium sp.]